MIQYFCGCKKEDMTFTFCPTHALSPGKRMVDNMWFGKYKESDWEQYIADLATGMGLEEIKTDDESHPCVTPGCRNIVPYDDEPNCYDHSPDMGSGVLGYSYKKMQNEIIDRLHGSGASKALEQAYADGSIFPESSR